MYPISRTVRFPDTVWASGWQGWSLEFFGRRISGTVWPRQSTERSGATENAPGRLRSPLRLIQRFPATSPSRGDTASYVRVCDEWRPFHGYHEDVGFLEASRRWPRSRSLDLPRAGIGSAARELCVAVGTVHCIRCKIDSSNAAWAVASLAQEMHGRPGRPR
jgi:hypothetical protein